MCKKVVKFLAGFGRVVCVGVVLVVFVGVTSASTVSVVAGEESEPVPVEVEFYALEYAVSHAEASRRLQRIGVIKQVLAEIREVEKERLAGWGIDHRDKFTGWVLLTGDKSVSAEATVLANAHSDVEIRSGAQHSYAELQAAQRALSAQLFTARNSSTGAVGNTGQEDQPSTSTQGGFDDNNIGVAEVVTFLETDMAGNAVSVGIDPGLASEVGPLGTVSELPFEQSAAVIKEMLQNHIEVAYIIADGRGIAPATTFQGGDAMSNCTAGFTARQASTGNYGIITAGHCGNEFPADTKPVIMSGVSLPFVYGWLSPTADAQFHKIPVPSSGTHHVSDDYVCRNLEPAIALLDLTCDLVGTEARANMLGDFVCHAGRRSGVSCGTVMTINHQLKWSGKPCRNSSGQDVGCEHVFVRVHGTNLRGCEGDSGGPFYSNRIAYGILAGGIHVKDCKSGNKWITFSAIREVEAFLGVQVLTEPVTLRAS